MKLELPLSRSEDIVVQELKDELLVCDTKNNQVFCLNQTAGEVWKLCDGKNSVPSISQILSKKFKTTVSEELVLFSLEELSNRQLLSEKVQSKQTFLGMSRREVIKRIGVTSMIALPLIASVTMPSAVQAQSSCDPLLPLPDGCSCADAIECDSGCCAITGVCATLDRFDPANYCGGGVDCPAPFICCTNFNNGVVGQFNCSCDGRC